MSAATREYAGASRECRTGRFQAARAEEARRAHTGGPDLEALTEAEGIAIRPGPRPRIDPDIVATLRQAVLANRKVKLHYKYRGSGKTGYDTVRPYGFIYGNRHYLVAWSENEQARDFRNFAMSKFERVELLEKSFTCRRGFSLKEYAERSFGVFQEEPFDVVWKFSQEVVEDVKEYLFHPSPKFEEQTDGSLIVRFRAGGDLGRSIERTGSQEIDRAAEGPSAASSRGKRSAFVNRRWSLTPYRRPKLHAETQSKRRLRIVARGAT